MYSIQSPNALLHLLHCGLSHKKRADAFAATHRVLSTVSLLWNELPLKWCLSDSKKPNGMFRPWRPKHSVELFAGKLSNVVAIAHQLMPWIASHWLTVAPSSTYHTYWKCCRLPKKKKKVWLTRKLQASKTYLQNMDLVNGSCRIVCIC